MQLAYVTLLSFGLGVSASVIDDTPTRVGRDLPTITTVINSVGDKISALDSAVTSYTGGDSTAFQSAATDLETTIKDGVTQVQGTAAITLSDALALQSLVTSLQSTADKLVSDLAAKKTQIESAGLCSTVQDQSSQLNTLSGQLIDAITSKVPTEAQSIASQLTAGFTAALQQNQANFAQGNCTNAAGSGTGSSSASAGSTASATASSTATSRASSGASATTRASSATGTTRPTATGGSITGSSRPSGVSTATSSGPATVVTAGAALNAVPIGGLAFGFAAMMM